MDECANAWEEIGGLVGISPAVLKTYPTKSLNDNKKCLREVLNKWMEMTSEMVYDLTSSLLCTCCHVQGLCVHLVL